MSSTPHLLKRVNTKLQETHNAWETRAANINKCRELFNQLVCDVLHTYVANRKTCANFVIYDDAFVVDNHNFRLTFNDTRCPIYIVDNTPCEPASFYNSLTSCIVNYIHKHVPSHQPHQTTTLNPTTFVLKTLPCSFFHLIDDVPTFSNSLTRQLTKRLPRLTIKPSFRSLSSSFNLLRP